MRKQFLFISFLFFAFVFQSDKPIGWYVQPIPVNDMINDIYFTDSLNGWAVTDGSPISNDTGYIMRTTNGGVNWVVQFDTTDKFHTIQFLDNNTGYAGGGFGRARFLKTTNGGMNWDFTTPFGSGTGNILDLKFINTSTGWICSDDNSGGGVFKTINGGVNWIRQLDQSYLPKKLFFLNQDTGWVISDLRKLYRTNNAGTNWFLQGNWNFISCIYFPSRDTGYASGDSTGFMKTINGGSNWTRLNNPVPGGSYGLCVHFINNSTGWFGSNFGKVLKISDGQTVQYQNVPSFTNNSIQFFDSLVGYSGGAKMIKTTDGGGPVVSIINNSFEVITNYKLYQNYPNPFNPNTVISYRLLVSGIINIKIYDLRGKEIATLVNERKSAGNYTINFDASKYNLSSGIYFYTLTTDSFKETKKMLLTK